MKPKLTAVALLLVLVGCGPSAREKQTQRELAVQRYRLACLEYDKQEQAFRDLVTQKVHSSIQLQDAHNQRMKLADSLAPEEKQNWLKETEESLNESVKLLAQMDQTIKEMGEFVDQLHADREAALQELVDKGYLSEEQAAKSRD